MKHWFTRFLVLLCCASWGGSAFAQREAGEFNDVAYFDFNQVLRDAHQHVLHLRFKDCKLILQKEKSRNPYNLMPYYLDDFVEFFKILANENHQEFLKYQEAKEVRLAKLRTGDVGSPYYLYTQASVHVHWAILHLRFDENSAALRELRKAQAFLEKNKKDFPDFMANRMALGVVHVIAGICSGDTRLAVASTGITGSVDMGLREMQAAIDFGKKYPRFEFNEEAQIMYALMLLEVGSDEANLWNQLNTPLLDYRKSPMAAYVLSGMYLRMGNSSKALAVLEASPPTSDENYHPFYYLDYLKGLCWLYKLDVKAEPFIKKFLDKYPGVHFIKDAYQKMAWCYLLKGNVLQYQNFMQLAKDRGNTSAAADAKAHKDAVAGGVPNAHLVKAQLLFEGGYFEKALAEANACAPKTDAERIEHAYRKGSALQRMKRFDEALQQLSICMELGRTKNAYLACQSALQAGMIWEDRKDYAKAKEFYNLCLKINPDVYKKLLHDRAKFRLEALRNAKK